MKIALSLEEMSLGGGPKFTLTLGRCLVEAGHHVTVVTERQGEWWPQLAASGLAGYCLSPRPGASFVNRACQLAGYWNEQDFEAVMLNVSDLNRLAQCAAHMLADRTAVILILHGDWKALYRLAGKDIAAWNCAVGVSPKVQAGAAARFPQKPVFGISNGVAVPADAGLQTRLDWELPLRLLFVGRLVNPHKGIFRLPAILAACRRRSLPVRLTVIGDGEDRERLAELFVEEGVNDLVEMTGALPPAAIAAAMRRHHVFVFPTNTEGMPLAVLEAQANGCVVITTALAGITDVAVEDRVSGRLVEPGNIEHFAGQIADMLAPAVWQSHSRAAVERTRRLFSEAEMGRQYLNLLEALGRGAWPLARPYNQTHALGSIPFTRQDYLPPFLLRFWPTLLLRKLGKMKRKLGRAAARIKHGKI